MTWLAAQPMANRLRTSQQMASVRTHVKSQKRG